MKNKVMGNLNKKMIPNKIETNNTNKNELRNSYISILCGLLLFGSCFIFYRHETQQLDTEPAYTRGILIGYQGHAKGNCTVKFMFVVNGVKYISSDAFSNNYDNFKFGDTCYVKYARSNPQNCRLEKIEVNGHTVLKLKRQIDNAPNLVLPK